MFLWGLVGMVAFAVLYGSWSALVSRAGVACTALDSYILLKYCLPEREDIFRSVKVLACIRAVLSIFMLLECFTGRNLFAMFGGVSPISEIRDGLGRAQGPFEHSILAGTFAATLIPLFIWLWRDEGGSKVLGVVGLAGAPAVVMCTVSSTPAVTDQPGGGCGGGIEFLPSVRKRGPVHASLLGLVGGRNNNQLDLDVLLLLAIVVRSVGRLGKARKLVEGERNAEFGLWALGAAMFAHVVAFFRDQLF